MSLKLTIIIIQKMLHFTHYVVTEYQIGYWFNYVLQISVEEAAAPTVEADETFGMFSVPIHYASIFILHLATETFITKPEIQRFLFFSKDFDGL